MSMRKDLANVLNELREYLYELETKHIASSEKLKSALTIYENNQKTVISPGMVTCGHCGERETFEHVKICRRTIDQTLAESVEEAKKVWQTFLEGTNEGT